MIWLLRHAHGGFPGVYREDCPVGGTHARQFATKECAEAFVIGMVLAGRANPGDWEPFAEPGLLRSPCTVDKTA